MATVRSSCTFSSTQACTVERIWLDWGHRYFQCWDGNIPFLIVGAELFIPPFMVGQHQYHLVLVFFWTQITSHCRELESSSIQSKHYSPYLHDQNNLRRDLASLWKMRAVIAHGDLSRLSGIRDRSTNANQEKYLECNATPSNGDRSQHYSAPPFKSAYLQPRRKTLRSVYPKSCTLLNMTPQPLLSELSKKRIPNENAANTSTILRNKTVSPQYVDSTSTLFALKTTALVSKTTILLIEIDAIAKKGWSWNSWSPQYQFFFSVHGTGQTPGPTGLPLSFFRKHFHHLTKRR